MTTLIVPYCENARIAQKNLVDCYGQKLYGQYKASFKSCYVKYLTDFPSTVIGVFNSNIVQHYEQNSATG